MAEDQKQDEQDEDYYSFRGCIAKNTDLSNRITSNDLINQIYKLQKEITKQEKQIEKNNIEKERKVKINLAKIDKITEEQSALNTTSSCFNCFTPNKVEDRRKKIEEFSKEIQKLEIEIHKFENETEEENRFHLQNIEEHTQHLNTHIAELKKITRIIEEKKTEYVKNKKEENAADFAIATIANFYKNLRTDIEKKYLLKKLINVIKQDVKSWKHILKEVKDTLDDKRVGLTQADIDIIENKFKSEENSPIKLIKLFEGFDRDPLSKPLIYGKNICYSNDDIFCVKFGVDIDNLCFVIYRWGAWRRFDPLTYTIEIDLNQEYEESDGSILINRLKNINHAKEFINYYNKSTLSRSAIQEVTLDSTNYKKLYYFVSNRTFFTESIEGRNQPNTPEYDFCYPVFINNKESKIKYIESSKKKESEVLNVKAKQVYEKALTDLKTEYSKLRRDFMCKIIKGPIYGLIKPVKKYNQTFNERSTFSINVLGQILNNQENFFKMFIDEFNCQTELEAEKECIPFESGLANSARSFGTRLCKGAASIFDDSKND